MPSTRRNPVLADVFNRLGYMERKGSGFGRIISSYEFQANYSEDKKPKFRSDRYQFTVVMPNLNYGVDEHNVEFINDTKEISGANDAKVGANDANMENQIDILMKKMIENPQITQNKLASELGVSRRTVQRMIEKLVSDAKIIRVGSKMSGYCYVYFLNSCFYLNWYIGVYQFISKYRKTIMAFLTWLKLAISSWLYLAILTHLYWVILTRL